MGFNRAEAEKQQSKGRYKLVEGPNYIRVLPPSSDYFNGDITEISATYLMHFGIEKADGTTAFACPKTLDKDASCPICELVWQLRKNGGSLAEKKASRMSVTRRYLYNILVKNVETGSLEMRVLETGVKIQKTLFGYVLSAEYTNHEVEPFGSVIDPQHGRAFKITKIPPGNGNEYPSYEVQPMPTATNIVDSLPEGWKEKLDELRETIPPILSYDELATMVGSAAAPQVVADPLAANTPPAVAQAPVQAPAVAQAPAQVPVTPAAVQPQTNVVAVGERPECFGKSFDKTSTRCIECTLRQECVREAMAGGL